MNYKTQYYKGIPLNLVKRKYGSKQTARSSQPCKTLARVTRSSPCSRQYGSRKAKRYVVNHTNQNVWIPNKHLEPDGTIRAGENIDYVFRQAKRKLEIAGITGLPDAI